MLIDDVSACECMLSIIIPYYCTPEPLFEICMSSILSVESDQIEVLVIDDGSPEQYGHVINKYKSDRRVHIFRNPNGGVSRARNYGIEHANGKWIMFVDSDDYINTRTLEKVLLLIRDSNYDIVLFNGGYDKNGIIKNNTSFLQENINYATNEESRIAVMSSALTAGILPEQAVQYYSVGAPYGKLLKTEMLQKNHILFDTEVKLAEDTLFSLETYFVAESIYYKDWNLYYYVFNEQSVTRRYRPGLSNDLDLFLEKTRAFLIKCRLEQALDKSFYIRVQFEIGRVFTREFFHHNNNDAQKRKKYIEFISREPYCSALKKDYIPKCSIEKKTKYFLIKHGLGRAYSILFNTRIALIRLARAYREKSLK